MPPATDSRILVAGIGNIFLGDDAFGVEVARRLGAVPLPPEVRVADFGIRGLDLAFELLDRPDGTAILVDATPRGGAPGTVYLIELDAPPEAPSEGAWADAHSMTPGVVLALLNRLGGTPPRMLHCSPASSSSGTIRRRPCSTLPSRQYVRIK